MKHVNLLFTGGFDSTFRLCQLSRMEDVEVQPVYLLFSNHCNRPNRFKEIAAQDSVVHWLYGRVETKSIILPPLRIKEEDLPSDPDYDMAFLKWASSGKVPLQYRVLGKLALCFSDLEICREGPTLRNRQRGIKYGNKPVGKTRLFLAEHGVKFIDNVDGSVTLNFKKADAGLDLLFGRYKYPILGISETEMVPYIQKWGYEDVFKLTWTCDTGANEPCGVCHNCETKWDSGLRDFFTAHAIRNHEIMKFLETLKAGNRLSPVELVSKDELPDMFRFYCGHNYDFCINPMEGVLTQPLSVQPINLKFNQMRKANVQAFFDSLIQAWDSGKKDEILATLS